MSTAPYRVFTVEDYPAMRARIGRLIQKEEGLELAGQAGSAEETLSYLEQTSTQAVKSPCPHLWLIDLSLPGMNGFELIENLIEHCPNAHCLVLTSYAETHHVDKALTAGAKGYVVKGNPARLLESIKRVLRGKRVVPDFYRGLKPLDGLEPS